MLKSMTRTRTYIQESSRLAEKKDDGSYRVILITEGTGSTGVYSAELIDSSAHVYENVPSYMDHPIDPEHPEKRPVLTIGGRFKNVEAEGGPLGRQLAADFTPREEYRPLFEEFGDILGLSIFCGAYGEKDETGRVVVEAFDAEDPYRSVDVVVAAGRGGRFKRASESLRAIESSLGAPKGNKPGATAAPGEKESNTMELKDLVTAVEALTKSLEPVVAFVAEQKAAADAAVAEAETKVAAAEQEKDAAIEAYSAAVKAVSEAELLPSQEASILAAAKDGKDVAPLIEDAKKVLEEAQAAVETGGYVIESADGSKKAHDYRIGGKR